VSIPYRSAELHAPAPSALGDVVSIHRARHRVTWAGATIIAVVLCPVGFYFGGPLVLVLGAALCAVWIAAGLLSAPRAIVLREDGVEVTRWIGESKRIAFDDVDRVFYDFGVYTTDFGTRVTDYAFILEEDAGRRVRVPGGVGDAAPLFQEIERRCVRQVRQEALAAFDQGETLKLGTLAIWRKGLSIGDRYVKWEDVKRIDASPRRVFIEIRGKLLSKSIPFASIPFPFVFLDLVQRARVPLRGIEGFEGGSH
jgi:hypothetical protein